MGDLKKGKKEKSVLPLRFPSDGAHGVLWCIYNIIRLIFVLISTDEGFYILCMKD